MALLEILKQGTYSSFEMEKRFVESFNRRITSRNAKFWAIHADLWHSYHNPTGRHHAVEYRFPYRDKSFDIIWLNSIFTHFLPDMVSHYLSELTRVLKDDGAVVASFFVVNEESLVMDKEGLSSSNLTLGEKQLLNYRYEYIGREMLFPGKSWWPLMNSGSERLMPTLASTLRRLFGGRGVGVSKVRALHNKISSSPEKRWIKVCVATDG